MIFKVAPTFMSGIAKLQNIFGFSRNDTLINLYFTGRLAQLVRALASHAGGQWFESTSAHKTSHKTVCLLLLLHSIITNVNSLIIFLIKTMLVYSAEVIY